VKSARVVDELEPPTPEEIAAVERWYP